KLSLKSVDPNSREDESSTNFSLSTLANSDKLKFVEQECQVTSDLEMKQWSVISERGCEASALTYEEARRLVHRLGGEGRHGLCIITDEAADRTMTSGPNKQ